MNRLRAVRGRGDLVRQPDGTVEMPITVTLRNGAQALALLHLTPGEAELLHAQVEYLLSPPVEVRRPVELEAERW